MNHSISFNLPRLLPLSASCDCCVSHLLEAIRSRQGVRDARNSATEVTIDLDPQLIGEAEAQQWAYEAGALVTRRYEHPELAVEPACCSDHAPNVADAITNIVGVHYATFNASTAILRLEYDREQVSLDAIMAALGLRGIRVGAPGAAAPALAVGDEQLVCSVEGMCCAVEAGQIERALRDMRGIRRADAQPALARLDVAFDPAVLSAAQITDQVARLGFRVVPAEQSVAPAAPAEESWQARLRSGLEAHPRNIVLALCLALFGAGWLLAGPNPALSTSLYVLATLVGLWFPARSGWAALRHSRTLDINTLMTVAAIGALFIGEYAEGAAVGALFAIGNALEGYTMGRARRSIRALMQLAPETALVRRGGHERSVPTTEVAIGETIIVRPGDRVALDGVVTGGHSTLNQAPVTGESVPVAKGPGAELFAGTINGEGALEVRVTRPASDSTIARIIHLVGEAQAAKAPAQRLIDQFAAFYTPAVFALALLVAIIPPLAFGAPSAEWLYRALVLLVIACPCALVIATPVTIVSAISAGARAGVLFKGGAALEAAGSLRALAFDKTGTLTLGKPSVTEIVVAEQSSTAELLRAAAAVERRSAHPLAQAIVAIAAEREIALPEVVAFESISGRGARGVVDGHEILVGNRALLAELSLAPHLEAALAAAEGQGRTAVLVGWGGLVRGVIAMADEPRAESAAALRELRGLGVERMAMLTGDTGAAAKRVAAQVGIAEVRASLMPAQKLAAIDTLMSDHKHVGMIGDGVNDAPALARATLGIAMGAAGSDTALETADVALMSDDLGRLPFAIRLSRRARNVMLQNIALALVIKGVFLVASLLGLATLWMAVFADTGAALIVIANGMQLLRARA